MGLLNDELLKDYIAIAIVEPYIYQHPQTGQPTVPAHRHWQTIRPTETRREVHPRHAFRAMLWVRHDLKAEPIETASADVVAAIIHTTSPKTLLVAAYDPNDKGTVDGKAVALQARLTAIESAIERAEARYGDVDTIVTTDLNRHHEIWGGKTVAPARQDESDAIVALMHDRGLASLLPAGTITWEHQSSDLRSTPDIILGSRGVQLRLIQCTIHATDYGSDHKAVHIGLSSTQKEETEARTRRLYKHAEWDRVREYIQNREGQWRTAEPIRSLGQLNEEASKLTQVVQDALEVVVPRAKPSPYAKRWWTDQLSTLRNTLTQLRNRVTTLRRRGEDTSHARERVCQARKAYFGAMDEQKKRHWTEFLNDDANIWKAHRYTRTVTPAFRVPTLQHGTQTAEEDDEKASLLMQTFYPLPPSPRHTDQEPTRPRPEGTPATLPKLTLREVQRAIKRAHPRKAAGPDEITFEVWQEIWPAIGQAVLRIYQASLDMRRLPTAWKTARIVTLRKPGRPDYTKPKAFRPISLLATISKGLEAVVAARLSYLAEAYQLLPPNHFGGRRKRSAEQALNVVVERIHEAWRSRRTLSLVSFDVQGAFNGVHPNVLKRRLRNRHIPEEIAEWVADFCYDRRATVQVGGYESEARQIAHSGIPQGSPLSPILYVFYNADLVEREIDKHGGSIGFIDDFNAWVTGDTEEGNTAKIQRTIIPHAEAWAQRSGAVFEAEKTSFIHFTPPSWVIERRSGNQSTQPLLFQGIEVHPQQYVKVLGVTLDTKLKMGDHVRKVSAKAGCAAAALVGIKGIRPKQMRQLYKACVVPIMDYAASAWYKVDNESWRYLRDLDKTQRLGARTVLRAFRTTGLRVLEAEASLEPTTARLERKVTDHVAKLLALPADHPAGKAARIQVRRDRRVKSPVTAAVQKYPTVLKKEGPVRYADRPWLQAPWEDFSALVRIYNEEKARAEGTGQRRFHVRSYYTDAAVQAEKVSIAVVADEPFQVEVIYRDDIGHPKTCSVLTAELLAIAAALHNAGKGQRYPRIRVLSDSQRALRAIAEGECGPAQRPALGITLQKLRKALEYQGDIRLTWVPAHKGVPGNEAADQVAKDPSYTECTSPKDMFYAREMAGTRHQLRERQQREAQTRNRTATAGRYTWQLDQALPGKHTKPMYDKLRSEEAAVLVQARTGHCHLRQSLHRLKRAETPECECGRGQETIKHVLFICPQWAQQRQALREVAGDRWGDASYLLGGWTTRKHHRTRELRDGPRDKWKPDMKVIRATIAFLQSTGRLEATRA